MCSFDILNYMGSIVGVVINLLRLNAMVDVTNMDMLKIMHIIYKHLIYPDKMLSIIIPAVIL